MFLRPFRFRANPFIAQYNVRPTLLRRLIRKFGYADAHQQVKWIQRELHERARTPEEGHKLSTRESMTGLISRLLRDEPLAYVLGKYISLSSSTDSDANCIGTQPFGSLLLRISRPVLIPRPETEE